MLQMRVSVTFNVPALPSATPTAIVVPDGLPSLFLLGDGSLTVRNIGGTNVACNSPPGVVAPNSSVTVEYTHDGRSTCVLSVAGGQSQFQVNAARGINNVGPAGISVGNVLEDMAIAQLPITVEELQIFKFDLADAMRCIADVSHVDKSQLQDVTDVLRAEGRTQRGLSQVAYALMMVGQRIGAATCNGDPAKVNHLNDISAGMAKAIKDGDQGAIQASIGEFQKHLAASALSQGDIDTYRSHIETVLSAVPTAYQNTSAATDLLRAFGVRGF